MAKGKSYWVVMIVKEFCATVFGQEIRLNAGKMVGYMPAYSNKKDAQKDFPDCIIMKVKEVK